MSTKETKQLFFDKDNPQEFYPKQLMGNVLDGEEGENLYSYLSKFNHINVGYVASSIDARNSVGNIFRKNGFYLTYYLNKKSITEIFIGTNEDAAIEDKWSNDDYWEFHDGVGQVESNSITLNQLSKEVIDLLGKGNNKIINYPDGEDLTEVDVCGGNGKYEINVLKFADKKYNPANFSGLGRIYLRKNLVEIEQKNETKVSKNVLTQEMINKPNTIYIIQYDYDLQGANIVLPRNTDLFFVGGSINNGSITFENGRPIGITKFEDAGNAKFKGGFTKGLIITFETDGPMWFDGTKWSKIAGSLIGGSLEPTAEIGNVQETSTPQADVTLTEDGKFIFDFGLPRGAKGEKGDKGETGDKGDQGPQGEQGPQGPAGDVSVSTQTFIVFKSTGENLDVPDTPTGGHWNSATNEFTPPIGWSRTDELEGIVWMSSGIFRSDTGELIDGWTIPVRITGQDGSNGADGTNIEFIFKLTETSLESPYLDITDSPNTNEYIPEGWRDSPTGISVEYQCEWVSTRRKEKSGSWSNWSEPAIWSKWGINGMDGDGVEYIFFRNNGASVSNPTPEDTSSDQYQEKGDYKDIEYIPAGWSDDPQGVNSDLKYEWVSQRKYRNNTWGKFSDPAVWAKYGDDGYSGLSLRTMYAKEDIGETPVVVKDNINPGSIWGIVFPDYNSETEAVWCIQAYVTYDNKLATTEDGAAYEGWQGPWIITGAAGKDGVPPNYKTYVYKKSDTKPAKPTGTDKIPSGWSDYPDDTGQWWQCIGTVNGFTELVTEWSEVLPVNGKDGTAQDGKKTEFRFAVNSSSITAPDLNRTIRNPNDWFIEPPVVSDGQYLWMTTATINPDDTLNGQWSTPVRISGEQGPQGNTGPAGERGPAGSQGVSGIPGVSIEVRYCLGTDSSYDGTSSPSGNNPSGWSDSIPNVTSSKPYIWCIQGRREYSSASDATGTIDWGIPFRLSGINGLNGTNGKKGQLVYPAGIYSNTTSYTTDEYKAPYVFDPFDDNFYVLNAQMTWLGTSQDNRTPAQDYTQNKGKYWLKFDAFEAVYAKIGIIANGLIGSMVFNGDFVFSQQGIDSSGSPDNTYENFNPSHIYDGNFCPNFLVNCATGEGHFAAGAIKFNKKGAKIGSISLDSNGNAYGDFYQEYIDNSSYNITLPSIPKGYSKTIRVPFTVSRALTIVRVVCETSNAVIIHPNGDINSTDYSNAQGSVNLQPSYSGLVMLECFGTNQATEQWIIGFSKLTGEV